MKLRSVIIDDEETGIETLRLMIEKYVGDDVKVVAETTSPKQAIELIENYLPEIVFLDISMPEMNGFELLEKLAWKNFNLIFTTAHQEHGLKALKLNAVDYLLKPVDNEDLCLAIAKIKKQIELKKNNSEKFEYSSLNKIDQFYSDKMAVNTKEGIEYIDPLDIVYFESRSNYSLIYLNSGKTLLTPKALKDFEAQLCNSGLQFIRVHNSYIINLHKVLRYTKDDDTIVMTGNQKIPLSKSRREDFLKWLDI